MPVIDGSDGDFPADRDEMIQNPSEEELDQFSKPIEDMTHSWHMIDDLLKIECRKLSDDTYQLRSPSHIVLITKTGFELYRDGSPEGITAFEDWLDANGIIPIKRTDVSVEDSDD